jgi:hypothetical protein
MIQHAETHAALFLGLFVVLGVETRLFYEL